MKAQATDNGDGKAMCDEEEDRVSSFNETQNWVSYRETTSTKTRRNWIV